MKIGLIAPAWNPVPSPKCGFSEAVVDGLARALVKAGHQVELFALVGSTIDVPLVEIPHDNRSWPVDRVFDEATYVTQVFERLGDYDVIHDNTTIGGLYARAFPDKTFVTTNHGGFLGDRGSFYKHILPWCTVVAVSESQAESVDLPVEFVHHGVDTERFSFGEGQGDERGEYFAFVGRMHDTDGPHLAAQAARAAGKRLKIATHGIEEPDHEFFVKHVEPQLDDDVTFLGPVNEAEKIALIQNAHALINPVIWPEPFGLVMAEAISCGTPVITLANGAASEIVENGVTGFVCYSELDLVNACMNIGEISRDACRKSALSYFSIERMAADYVKIYKKAIARETPRSREIVDLTPPSQLAAN